MKISLFILSAALFAAFPLAGAEKKPSPAAAKITPAQQLPKLANELNSARRARNNAEIHRLYKKIAALDAAKLNPAIWSQALNAEAETLIAEGKLKDAGAALRAIGAIKGQKPASNLLRLYVEKAIESGNFYEAETEAEELFARDDFRGKGRETLIRNLLAALLRAEKYSDAAALAGKLHEIDRMRVEVNAMIDKEKLKDARKETLSHVTLYALAIVEANARESEKVKLPGPLATLTQAGINSARLEAAKIFMAAGDFEKARAIGVLPPQAVPVYALNIMDEAPSGVAGWQHSALVKDAKKRESRFETYNQKAAELLVLDVNMVRNTQSAAQGKTCPLSFFAAADKYGIHLYIECTDDRQDEVLAGLESGGMYEMYLVPGFGECYYQWMVTPGARTKVECIAWNSRGRDYRMLDDYLKVDFAKIPGGFGLYQFISWNAVFDKLPDDRSQWPLGIIPWVRAGGFTWGSGQVHELHRFGRLDFNGIGKILPAVKRQIVLSALAKYKRESGDIRTFWEDEIKGDRAYYQAVLVPEFARLDALAKEVKPEMTRETVEKLYREAVPAWNEIGFHASALRAKWLKKRLIDTGK